MFTIKMPHHMRKNIQQNWDPEAKCYHVSENEFSNVVSLLDHWKLQKEGLVVFRDGQQMELSDAIHQDDRIKVSFMTMGG